MATSSFTLPRIESSWPHLFTHATRFELLGRRRRYFRRVRRLRDSLESWAATNTSRLQTDRDSSFVRFPPMRYHRPSRSSSIGPRHWRAKLASVVREVVLDRQSIPMTRGLWA